MPQVTFYPGFSGDRFEVKYAGMSKIHTSLRTFLVVRDTFRITRSIYRLVFPRLRTPERQGLTN